MSYDVALAKAWLGLENLVKERKYSVSLLADEYDVNLDNKRVLSLACNVPAKTHVSIIVLHYLAKKLQGLPQLSGEWISFKQLEGGDGYYPAFKKRVIQPLVRKYGDNPEAIFEALKRINAKKAQFTEISIVVDVLEGAPFLITLQRADDEFGPEANLLFDKSIKDIFSTEDVVVLAEFVVGQL